MGRLNDRRKQVGFSQRIQLEWMEHVAGLALEGCETEQIRRGLQAFLRDRLSVDGDSKRGNREKAVTILMKIWVTVPRDLREVRDKALELLMALPAEAHLAVHWGMSMAVYPFWGRVAGCVGRLFKLQGSASAAEVQRRLREEYGERETVSRSARRVLRAFVDWGVTEEGAARGVYDATERRAIRNAAVAGLLVQSSLLADSVSTKPLDMAFRDPALFPFSIRPVPSSDLSLVSGVDVVRTGIEQELLTLGVRWNQ